METYIELMDRYLQNEMDALERSAFEEKLKYDLELRREFEVQQQIMKGIENAGIRGAMEKALKQRIRLKNTLKWGGFVTATAIVCGMGYVYFDRLERVKDTEKIPAGTIIAMDSVIMPGLKQQEFEVDNTRDTIIETSAGIVFAIPAGTFETMGNKVQLGIKEALNTMDIIKAGLSTMSDGRLLETRGMFTIEAFANEEKLKMMKNIIARVPSDSTDPKMMLFRGEKDSNNSINWVDPKPIVKAMNTVDIESLDFYPINYLSTLESLKLDFRNKKFTDSLYYSFSGYKPVKAPENTFKYRSNDYKGTFRNIIEYPKTGEIEGLFREQGIMKRIKFKNRLDFSRFEDSMWKKWKKESKITSNRNITKPSDTNISSDFEIDPSRIKAIWNPNFNYTILATKSFERRLKFIFTTCQARYLNYYINNLDKKLYEIDSICAANASGSHKEAFLGFCEMHEGGVPIKNKLVKKLNRYFENSYKAYKIASEKTWKKFREEEQRLQAIADEKIKEQEMKEMLRTNTVFNEELCMNLVDAYRQLGEKKDCPIKTPPPSPTGTYYEVSIMQPGTYNLDKYVSDATVNRNSLTYVTGDGKKAEITYTPVDIIVDKIEQYNRVMVYLLPKGLSSFQRVFNRGTFKEKLNGLLEYDLVVLAFKGEQMYFTKRQNIKPGNILVGLKEMKEADIEKELNMYDFKKPFGLLSDLGYQKFEQKELNRTVERIKKQYQVEQILRTIFPCNEFGIENRENVNDSP